MRLGGGGGGGAADDDADDGRADAIDAQPDNA